MPRLGVQPVRVVLLKKTPPKRGSLIQLSFRLAISTRTGRSSEGVLIVPLACTLKSLQIRSSLMSERYTDPQHSQSRITQQRSTSRGSHAVNKSTTVSSSSVSLTPTRTRTLLKARFVLPRNKRVILDFFGVETWSAKDGESIPIEAV